MTESIRSIAAPASTRVTEPSGYYVNRGDGKGFVPVELFVGGVPKISTDDEVVPEPTGTLWKGDLTQPTLSDAMNWNYLHGGYITLGSIIDSTTVPTTTKKAFRSVIPINAQDQGYRAHNELNRVATEAFPRSSVKMEYYFQVGQMGGIQTAEAKIGYGLAGAPENAAHNEISYLGTKLSSSWSARTTFVPANSVTASHPWCMASFLYAHHAGGETYSLAGLRKLYLNASNQTFSPVEGTWYKHTVEFRENTPGQNNGVYKCSIDDIVYLNLTDVRWNETGAGPVSHLTTQTFASTDIATTEFHFNQSEPSLISVP